MLEVYRDNQNQATPKTIGFCIYRWFVPRGYNGNPATKTKLISQPISSADVGEAHVTTLRTVPSQSKNLRDSNITLVTPSHQKQSRTKNHSEAITITRYANSEPLIQELAEIDDATNSVIWDQKNGLVENIKIMCPNPWTTIDPYDVHVQKVDYKDHGRARRLRRLSQEQYSYFAKFKIFSISTTAGKPEWLAGWARTGLSLNFVLIIAHKLEILSSSLQTFIISMTTTALELYNQNGFSIPESPQILCDCFQLWREEPLKFSLKFSMPYLAIEGHTTNNQQHTHTFLGYLEEMFRKWASAKIVNPLNGCQDDTRVIWDRKRVDNDLSRIFAHKDIILPQETLNTMADRPKLKFSQRSP